MDALANMAAQLAARPAPAPQPVETGSKSSRLDGEPIWPGYLDGEQWTLADGMPVNKVVRWAEMSKGGDCA